MGLKSISLLYLLEVIVLGRYLFIHITTTIKLFLGKGSIIYLLFLRKRKGVSMKRILTDLCDTASVNNFARIHLLGNMNLRNTKEEFSIKYSTKLHENDKIIIIKILKKAKLLYITR